MFDYNLSKINNQKGPNYSPWQLPPWQLWLSRDNTSEDGFDQWSQHQHHIALRSTEFLPIHCRHLQPITWSCGMVTVSRLSCASHPQGPIGLQGLNSIRAEHASQPTDTDKGSSLSAHSAVRPSSSRWLSTKFLSCCGRHEAPVT